MARCRMHLDVLAAATVAVTRTWAETNPLALAEFTQAYEQGQRIADTNRPAVERAMEILPSPLGVSPQVAAVMALDQHPHSPVDVVRIQWLT